MSAHVIQARPKAAERAGRALRATPAGAGPVGPDPAGMRTKLHPTPQPDPATELDPVIEPSPEARSLPQWRALLEARWQARLRQITELSLTEAVAGQVGEVVTDEGAAGRERDEHRDPWVGLAGGRNTEGDDRALARQYRRDRVERGDDDRDEIRYRRAEVELRQVDHAWDRRTPVVGQAAPLPDASEPLPGAEPLAGLASAERRCFQMLSRIAPAMITMTPPRLTVVGRWSIGEMIIFAPMNASSTATPLLR